MATKPYSERLAIAGALLAAEIDRRKIGQQEGEDSAADDGKLQDM